MNRYTPCTGTCGTALFWPLWSVTRRRIRRNAGVTGSGPGVYPSTAHGEEEGTHPSDTMR